MNCSLQSGRRVQGQRPTQLALLLGGLLAAHASLRFGDFQRISLGSLSLSATPLRGICWAIKTSSNANPLQ